MCVSRLAKLGPTQLKVLPMVLSVTFDTNVLDLACRPERFPKDPRGQRLHTVKDALIAGTINGFYPVTMLTIEGIMRKDRAEVFSGTRIRRGPETASAQIVADRSENSAAMINEEAVELLLSVEQPNRKPLHSEVIARTQAAHALGVRALKSVPRIGNFHIDDPKGEFYLTNGEGDSLANWITKTHEVCRAIESRGIGIAQVKALGQSMAGPQEAWFSALQNSKDIHDERAIERAFGEWADADAIASHIAYGIDVFCSSDVGNSNVQNSVLDSENRAWLTSTYGVRFMNFDELLASLP